MPFVSLLLPIAAHQGSPIDALSSPVAAYCSPTAASKASWWQSPSRISSPVDFASLASPQGAEHRVLVCSQNPVEAGLEVASIEGCQEAQGPHTEADDGGQGGVLHKEGGQMQHCAVTAKRYAKVYICRASLPIQDIHDMIHFMLLLISTFIVCNIPVILKTTKQNKQL